MFKPLQKSLHYVLVFPSLLAIFLTTHPPRMGKVSLDPLYCSQDIDSQLQSEGDTGEVKQGFPNVCHSQLPSSQTEIWNWHHLSCVFSEIVSHSTTTLWLGLHWSGKVLSKEWLLFCILLIKSIPIKLHFVTSDIHTVMEEFQIYTLSFALLI